MLNPSPTPPPGGAHVPFPSVYGWAQNLSSFLNHCFCSPCWARSLPTIYPRLPLQYAMSLALPYCGHFQLLKHLWPEDQLGNCLLVLAYCKDCQVEYQNLNWRRDAKAVRVCNEDFSSLGLLGSQLCSLSNLDWCLNYKQSYCNMHCFDVHS